MLCLTLISRNDGPLLEPILELFTDPKLSHIPRVIIDLASGDGTRDRLLNHLRRHPGQLVTLDTDQLSAPEIQEISRLHSEVDYILPLTVQDRLRPDLILDLDKQLQAQMPDLALLGSGFWFTSPAHPLPGLDAERAKTLPSKPSSKDLLRLTPDPRRLLWRVGGGSELDPFTAPHAAWNSYREALHSTDNILFQPAPAVLRHHTTISAAASLHACTDALKTCKRQDRAALLNQMLPWLSDALHMSPSLAAYAVIEAADALLAALPRALRRSVCADTSSIGRLLHALSHRQKAEALAILAMLSAARTEQHNQALAAEYATLRQDLNLALPGPDYLMELYTRLRHL